MEKFFETLISSWASDTPQEVFWALNDLLEYAKSRGFETDLLFENPLDASDDNDAVLNNEELVKKLAEFFDTLKL